ncbi:phage integrase SAM-like domain-containing protein [Aureibaculum sp. A20]|uniref:Phage integrase SAM-like domain-containing protein n=1 Tax=Aureibaculum flavum TaxID=2795986 RepID=A0ABS0WQC7_9FLAO|nr:phage integrase SAM-like domain-containing protein [Aureibaculum flavum]MBJ2174177.1 phage integrase SAM-like domain-containing protein [Aureibaculum flavum]
MASINFLYRSTKNKADLVLRLLYRSNEKDYVFGVKTKLEVTKEYWKKHHRSSRLKDIDIINKQTLVKSELNRIENHILSSFKGIDSEFVNKSWLEAQVNQFYNPIDRTEFPTDLINYIDKYIEVKQTEVTKSSLKKFRVIKRKLERFQNYRYNIILIKEVDLNFKAEFEKYCISEQYAPNTIARDLRFIKTICNHAKYNGLETSYQLEKIKAKYQKVDSIYLTEVEIQKIESVSALPDHLENAKDWLIISCYTGQRVSDFMRFNKSMVRMEKNKEGVLKPLIEFSQKKTGKLMTVPLSQKVVEILNKRNGEFPRSISEQKYNVYIKEVCKLAQLNKKVKGSKKVKISPTSKKYRKEIGIYQKWELVTSHIGRRSFATNHYGKIPTSFLIYITGHSTEAMFLSYIGKSNKDIAMELTNYLN